MRMRRSLGGGFMVEGRVNRKGNARQKGEHEQTSIAGQAEVSEKTEKLEWISSQHGITRIDVFSESIIRE